VTTALDFGTSTTLLAGANGIVDIGDGIEPALPSLLGYTDDGELVIGEDAAQLSPTQVVRSVKRSITERRDFVPVDLPAGVRDVRVDDLVGHLLHEAVRRGAARGLDVYSPGSVRLGCPAMWDGPQRRRLVEAAGRAGLAVTLESLVDEPVAAGIAWLSTHAIHGEGPLRVVVFDMGGGTLDVAVLDVRGPHLREVSVLAALGAPEAGDALDESIADDLDFALVRYGLDTDALPHPDRARELLVDAARRVKVRLSTEEEAPVVLARDTFGRTEMWYTREQLNAVFARQMDRAEQYVAAALRVARLTELAGRTAHDIARLPTEGLVSDVDLVLLSGGMSQIPYVAQQLGQMFPPSTRIETAAARPPHAVALGLARTHEYGRLNMYRPAFDVALEWDAGEASRRGGSARRFRTVYESFTPLVEAAQIARGSADLRYVRTGSDLSLPHQGRGMFRVKSYSDSPVRATMNGAKLDGFPVTLGERFEFSIYPNGKITVVDGAGIHVGQIEDWHTVG
jgi:molecular chaperone DnaK (HSP70)